MKKVGLVLIVITSMLFQMVLSYAEIPKLINYQGHLTNKVGNPLTGTVSITFTIYDAETYGNTLWTETQSNVAVKNGLFNILLGSASIGGVPENIFDEADRWLGIAVDADLESSPRQQLVSVPYAYKAGNEIPSGVIVMWSGSITNIPNGWVLCDGSDGTPDLRNMFIIGAGSSHNIGDTGGEPDHNHAISSFISSHTHISGTYQLDTLPTGGSHITNTSAHGVSVYNNKLYADTGTAWDWPQVKINVIGSSGAAEGSLEGETDSTSALPPYYALAYIMKQ